ncbi:arginyl-tRNA--protein transferase 1 isoform X1 [Hermetia illucens]|uniref:arginyl-tRNA--protein transferase 1 isoform X1 n=1 Tax=Hermetia illucens TaxID=343691 RepID=UPI0018CC480D|nr:arginyl-tRNA--protein transferase 1 isoform X1 [Hermetia illucens]
MQRSIVQYYGEQNRSRCGYCRNSNTSNSHGMHAYTMTPHDYQDLIDRGWRRSGNYCYKPNNPATCCPSYTIRCDVHDFKLSKSQKKVLKRINRFLLTGIKEKGESQESDYSREVDQTTAAGESDGLSREEPDIPQIALKDIEVTKAKEEFLGVATTSNAVNVESTAADLNLVRSAQGEKRRDDANSADSQEPVRPPCKKAKQMRLERRQAKLAAKGITEDTSKLPKAPANQEKSLSDYIEEVHENPRHKLTLKLVEVNSKEFEDTQDESYRLYKKYQTFIHRDPPEGTEDYLYFLGNSPLQYQRTHDGPEQGYGSFHQQYWLDDRLIAVGVIDILPYCVSSVYFFYDPDFNFLSLGTYGSLREVYLTDQLSQRTPALKYYYMGFYIHTCPKMIYKGRLSASYLLCPEVYSWHLLNDEIRKKLDESKYQRLNADPDARDANEFREEDLDAVLVLINQNSYMTYRNYAQSFCVESVDQVLDFLRRTLNIEALGPDETRAELLEYGRFVGRQCAHRMLFVKL